jgi:peptide deformylase
MAALNVLTFPHPLLKQKALPVTRFDDELKTLAADMLDTMYAEGGIGLAANQVGQLKRLVVTDLQNEDEPRPGRRRPREPRVWVNPSLLASSGEMVTEEGCLSVVDFRAEVKRAGRIRVRYQTLEGKTREEDLDGLAAVCLQHELDHLDGKLFIDRLPALRRQMVRKRLIKTQRTA